MKKLLFAIFLTFLYSVSAYGQVPTNIPNTVIQVFPGAPTGACLSVMVATRQDTGAFYDCFGGVWTPVGGAGAGANSSLSNLSNPTSVNQSLIPGTTGLTLGTQANPWANIFIQSLTFPGLEVGFFCFPGTLPTPPTGYGGLGCIDANGNLNQYNIAASSWVPIPFTTPILGEPVIGSSSSGAVSTASSPLYLDASQFAGADIAAQITACNTAAIAAEVAGAGNVTCDDRAFGGTHSFGPPGITTGDGSHYVTHLFPDYCNWSATGFTGGAGIAVTQDNASSIISSGPAPAGCMVFNNSTTNGLSAVYATGLHAGGTYITLKGVGFASNGVTTASGAVILMDDLVDNSVIEDVQAQHYAATETGWLWGSRASNCCSISVIRPKSYGNNTGGNGFVLEGASGFSSSTIQIIGGSFGHVASGFANFYCHDVNASHGSAFDMIGTYLEDNPANTSSPIQLAGCGKAGFKNVTVNSEQAASTYPAITLDNTPTAVDISNFSMFTFTFPATVLSNNNTTHCSSVPCLIKTDTLSSSAGTLTHYSANTNWGDVFNAVSGYQVDGAALNFSNLAGSATVAQLPVATASTLGVVQPDNTTVTISAGVLSADVTAASNWSGIVHGANTDTGAFSTSGLWTFSGAGAASTPGQTFTGTLFTGGSGTTTVPYYYINQGTAPTTWSTNGTEFGINAPSGFTGNFIDVHLNGGASLMNLSNNGTLGVAGNLNSSANIQAGASNVFLISGRSKLSASADGLFLMSNNAVTGFTRLQLGGTTSSFPALKVNGAALNVRLADDSGDAALTSGPHTAPTYLTTTNCTSAAAPAVCGSASAGEVTIAAAASTVTVNTTAVTANSEIMLTQDISANGGTRLSVTCNSTPITLAVSAISTGTSFQITSASAALTNPDCIYYRIVN